MKNDDIHVHPTNDYQRNARFDHFDLNLWEIFAIDFQINVELTSGNYRKRLLIGFAERQDNNLRCTLKVFQSDPVRMISSQMNSGEINQFVSSLRTCLNNLPLNKRQKLAEIAINVIYQFAYEGSDSVKSRLVAVPGLLSTLASLCGEGTFLRNSHRIINDISHSAYNLSNGSPDRATALAKAGWADLLVKALRARFEHESDVDNASWAIYSVLLNGPIACGAAFFAAGAESALKDTLERYSTQAIITKRFCTRALKILARGRHK